MAPDGARASAASLFSSVGQHLGRPSAKSVFLLSCLTFHCVYTLGIGASLFAPRGSRVAPDSTSALVTAALVQSPLAAALRGAPSALHGRVRKAGPLDEVHWHPRAIPAMKENFTRYIRRQEEEGHGVLTPFTYPQCAIWANHAYRIIFVRHPKCGTTTVLHHLTLCSEPQKKESCLEPWSGSDSTIANMSSSNILRMWKDYFVFTVVRNPLSRAVSSYKFLLSATLATEKCSSMMDWDTFCVDPVVAGQMCRHRPKCCPFGMPFAFAHIPDQARCMMTEQGGLAVDFVARMEHLHADMAHVYAEINRRRPPDLPPLRFPARFSAQNAASPAPPFEQAGTNSGSGSACTDDDAAAAAAVEQQKQQEQHGSRYPSPFFGVVYNFSGSVAKESSYCSMRQFYSGRHEHCLQSIAQAYSRDLDLLYPPALLHR